MGGEVLDSAGNYRDRVRAFSTRCGDSQFSVGGSWRF